MMTNCIAIRGRRFLSDDAIRNCGAPNTKQPNVAIHQRANCSSSFTCDPNGVRGSFQGKGQRCDGWADFEFAGISNRGIEQKPTKCYFKPGISFDFTGVPPGSGDAGKTPENLSLICDANSSSIGLIRKSRMRNSESHVPSQSCERSASE